MKKNKSLIILMLLMIGRGFCEENNDNYLKTFFSSTEYKTKEYYFDNEKMLFSFVYSDNSMEIISKGIFYVYEDNKILPYLVIDNEKIFNNSKLLFQGIIKTQQFYGYKIKVIEKNKCISTDYYTDFGEHVTEGPTFLWNSKSKIFTKYEIDRSQF